MNAHNELLSHVVRTRTQWLHPAVNAAVHLANRAPPWLPRPLAHLPLRLCSGVIWLYVQHALAQDAKGPRQAGKVSGAGAKRKEGVQPPVSEAQRLPHEAGCTTQPISQSRPQTRDTTAAKH